MKKARLILALLAPLSASVQAAMDTYVTDPHHTFARFSYNHLGFSTQLSRFDKVSGTIMLDTVARKGAADITIDTRSVSTGSDHFNEHIQEADFLDTEKFPTATFKGDSVKFTGDTPTEIDGILTLKGISHPVALKITSFKCMLHPLLHKDACGGDAETHVKRSDFGMSKYVPYVGDDVTITVSVEAIKK
ncbi:YceI family protein [Ferrovum sp.]|jgi:polyisoprenoid-binding protein YceI|uniref:YceI family protein n=2 Tax=Ferrovum sp. TaxID=2609467 RepID=UPI00262D226B|nr:YceI family protein [Ferrovum sp.]